MNRNLIVSMGILALFLLPLSAHLAVGKDVGNDAVGILNVSIDLQNSQSTSASGKTGISVIISDQYFSDASGKEISEAESILPSESPITDLNGNLLFGSEYHYSFVINVTTSSAVDLVERTLEASVLKDAQTNIFGLPIDGSTIGTLLRGYEIAYSSAVITADTDASTLNPEIQFGASASGLSGTFTDGDGREYSFLSSHSGISNVKMGESALKEGTTKTETVQKQPTYIGPSQWEYTFYDFLNFANQYQLQAVDLPQYATVPQASTINPTATNLRTQSGSVGVSALIPRLSALEGGEKIWDSVAFSVTAQPTVYELDQTISYQEANLKVDLGGTPYFEPGRTVTIDADAGMTVVESTFEVLMTATVVLVSVIKPSSGEVSAPSDVGDFYDVWLKSQVSQASRFVPLQSLPSVNPDVLLPIGIGIGMATAIAVAVFVMMRRKPMRKLSAR